jgi:hypothetical protein
MENETTFKTLKIVNVLYRHMAEEHCRHTYSDIVREALGRKAVGPATNEPQQQDADTTKPRRGFEYDQKIIR